MAHGLLGVSYGVHGLFCFYRVLTHTSLSLSFQTTFYVFCTLFRKHIILSTIYINYHCQNLKIDRLLQGRLRKIGSGIARACLNMFPSLVS